jgi:hypothetical protein
MTARLAVTTTHWRARVLERLGRAVDAEMLAETLAWEIVNHGPNVHYLGRVSRDGKRAFRFSFSATLHGAALVILCGHSVRFITLYDSGWRIPREGKKSVRA